MILKTALMTGIATLMLSAAPALAQDAMAPAAPNPTPQTPPAAAAPAQPAALTLTPGSDVTGSDGTVLGKLVGARTVASGEQELTVRGADGTLRGVPLGGLRQEGAGVVVGWTSAEYQAAPAITDAAATPGATPGAAPAPVSDPAAAPTTEPMTDAPAASEPTTAEPTTAEPMSDPMSDGATPPTEPQA